MRQMPPSGQVSSSVHDCEIDGPTDRTERGEGPPQAVSKETRVEKQTYSRPRIKVIGSQAAEDFRALKVNCNHSTTNNLEAHSPNPQFSCDGTPIEHLEDPLNGRQRFKDISQHRDIESRAKIKVSRLDSTAGQHHLQAGVEGEQSILAAPTRGLRLAQLGSERFGVHPASASIQ